MRRLLVSLALMAKRSRFLAGVPSVFLFLVAWLPSLHAAITTTGNVEPLAPASWTTSTIGYIGKSLAGTLVVDFNSDLNSCDTYIGYDSAILGKVTVDGTGSTWANSGRWYIGYSGNGELKIIGGGLVGGTYSMDDATNGYVGHNSGSTGIVTVDGGGSQWTLKTCLSVGHSGNGTLNISNGGAVGTGAPYGLAATYIGNNSSSTGVVRIEGPGSTLAAGDALYVGNSGSGTLTLTNSGAVTGWVSSGYIGKSDGSTGTMTVDHGSAKFHSLYVGSAGAGTLAIANGGTLDSNSYSHIATASGSTGIVTVDGSGSTWNATRLNVGGYGNGTLKITNGGTVVSSGFDANSFDIACLGFSAGSTGEVIVDGAGSTWTHGNNLYVGHYGNGTLRISGGASVTATSTTYLADGIGSTGTIVFENGGGTFTTHTLAVSSPTQLAGEGTINAEGLISDFELLFDASHLPTQFVFADQPGQHVTLNADFTTSGNANTLGMGYRGNGSLIVRDGAEIRSHGGYLGYGSASSGVAAISGHDSKWTNTGQLTVGFQGSGSLNVGEGATVSDTSGRIGYESAGIVVVSGARAQWINSSSISVGYYDNGTLNIAGGGEVNSTYGYLGYATGSTGIVSVDGNGTTWTNGNNVYVGYSGTASLKITGGGSVCNTNAYVGFNSGSTGLATVDGSGSTWTSSANLSVGYSGSGTMTITHGGAVNNVAGYIGRSSSSSTGLVKVDGAGSTWTNTSSLTIGGSGSGTLSIAGGGTVAATSVSVNSKSLVAIDIGSGSQLTIGGGTGAITNDGTVRILAGASVETMTYTPISATLFTNSGTWQAVGGTWDADSHHFAVSAPVTGSSGAEIAEINLASTQRVLVSGSNNWAVGASFLAQSSTIDFTATAINDTALPSLQGLLASGDSVLSGWEFLADNYTVSETNPVYLSLKVGSGHSLDDLDLWHYSTLTDIWEPYTALDLTYDGTYASFTVTGFSGYAVSGLAVPEPSAIILLSVGVASFLVWGWRQRKRTA